MVWFYCGEFLVRVLVPEQVRATPGTRGGDAVIIGAQIDAPQFVMGACFGEAALAGVHEGQAHLVVL